MKKTFLSFMLIIALAAHAYDVVVDRIYYDVDLSSMTAAVTQNGLNSYSGDVVVPEQITCTFNGYVYTFIVTTVKDFAFNGSTDLISVHFPNTIKDIGNFAFSGCINLKRMNYPESLETIGTSLIESCIQLQFDETINLPNIKRLGIRAFGAGSGAQKNIKHIYLGANLEFIGLEAMYGCGISSIDLPESVTTIEQSALGNCVNLTSIRIPDNLETIPALLFSKDVNLKKVVIGKACKEIQFAAFSECKKLKTIQVLSLTPPDCFYYDGTYVFDNNIFEQASLIVPDGSEELYKSADTWEKFFKSIPPDAIMEVKTSLSNHYDWYRLDGKKLNQPAKGISIFNRKKVLVK